MDPREKLIVALDVPSAAAASKIVAAVGNSVATYKVGLQLFTAEGPRVVRELLAAGRKVFLDLKYHDIPNTIASAVTQAAGLGAHMLTVHALGGRKMLRAAVEAAKSVKPHPKILAVTVLTSTDQAELQTVGVAGTVLDEVMRLADLALGAGCDGVVASAREATQLRRLGTEFLIVTPGVRPAGADHGDQARAVTPAEAIAAGASHIVVGRPIIGTADPAKAARDVLDEIAMVAPRIHSFS